MSKANQRRKPPPANPSLADVYIALSNKPMKLRFIPLTRVHDPHLDTAGMKTLVTFHGQVKGGKCPMCLLCDTYWPHFKCEPPAVLTMLATHEFFCVDPKAERPAIVSGICWDCWEAGDVPERAKEVFRRELWPDLRDVAEPTTTSQ